DVTVDDHAGGATVEPITVTLVGTDHPVVILGTAVTLTAPVTQSPASFGGSGGDTATGSFVFTDADAGDTHITSFSQATTFTPDGSSYRGTFAVNQVADSTGGTTGTVDWTFMVSDAQLTTFSPGQTETQAYQVTVDDGHGGAATETVSVVLSAS